MYSISLMLISAILAGFSAISLVKNFLVNFNVSDNGWKTALIAACLFCALFGYTEAYTIRDISVMQPSFGMKEEDIMQLRELIPQKKVNTNISVCIGYAAYFLHTLLIKNIRKNKLKEIELNAEHRWTKKV